MTAPHQDKPVQLSPRDLLTGELPAVFSRWQRRHTPEAAHTLLAAWAGLRRLAEGEPNAEEDRLNNLIQRDSVTLLRVACEKPLLDAEAWLRRAGELAGASEKGEEAPLELDWQASQLLEELDRAALAAWAVEQLNRLAAQRQPLDAAGGALGRADAFVAERVALFRSLAVDAGELLQAVRPGLQDQEPGLWDTLERYRRIKDAVAPEGTASGGRACPLPDRRLDSTSCPISQEPLGP